MLCEKIFIFRQFSCFFVYRFFSGGNIFRFKFFFLWNVDNKENFFILVKDGCRAIMESYIDMIMFSSD